MEKFRRIWSLCAFGTYLQDKYLLDHPELLKEYLKKRDNYKVDNFKVGGVNIHPAMRTNFKQGGLIKYEKGKEVWRNVGYISEEDLKKHL